MKMTLPNKHGKNNRKNKGMDVEQTAMGLQAEDFTTHTGTVLQTFTKVFLLGLPYVAQQ